MESNLWIFFFSNFLVLRCELIAQERKPDLTLFFSKISVSEAASSTGKVEEIMRQNFSSMIKAFGEAHERENAKILFLNFWAPLDMAINILRSYVAIQSCYVTRLTDMTLILMIKWRNFLRYSKQKMFLLLSLPFQSHFCFDMII